MPIFQLANSPIELVDSNQFASYPVYRLASKFSDV